MMYIYLRIHKTHNSIEHVHRDTHTSYSPFRPHVAETGHVVVQAKALISFRLNQANASVCFFLEYSMSNMLRDALHGHPPGLKAPIIIIINGRDVFNLEFRSTPLSKKRKLQTRRHQVQRERGTERVLETF